MKKYPFIVFMFLSIPFLFAEEKPIITVLDLVTDDVSASEMRTIISLLSSAVFRTDRFTVIDVAQRDILLKEIEFSAADCTDKECQIEIGKQLAAEMIVVGSIGQIGKKYVLAVKMLETATAKTISTADGIYTDLEAMVEDMENIAARLAGLPEGVPEKAVEVEEEEAEPEPVEGAVVVVEKKPLRGRKVTAFVLLGGGVVSGAVGGFLIFNAITYLNGPVAAAYNNYYEASLGSDFETLYNDYMQKHNSFKLRLYSGSGLAGAGVTMLATSIILFITSRKDKPEKEAVSLMLSPQERGVRLGFRVCYKSRRD